MGVRREVELPDYCGALSEDLVERGFANLLAERGTFLASASDQLPRCPGREPLLAPKTTFTKVPSVF